MATTPCARHVCVLVTFLASIAGSASAQTQAPAWSFESIAPGNLVPSCVTGGTLAGFEIDPQGRPALAWREENGCGGPPRVFWSRFESGAWQNREFFADRGNAQRHQFALRKIDGHPFMIFSGMGLFFETNTYRTNLDPSNQPSTFLENVAPPQNCDNARYSLAFGPADVVPQWVTGVAACNGQGPFRLNGIEIVPQYFSPHGSLAVSQDGTRHILWNSGTHVFYSRWPAAAAAPDHQLTLFTDLNRFGGDVKIDIDNAGILHAIVKGPDATADWDLGAIVYLRSVDDGATWSPWEYVDPHDDPAVQDPWNANSDVSLAIAPDGIPAITFWRWNSELWYAKRDGAGGAWTQQLISALPFGNAHRSNQLRFDDLGQPVVVFYDPAINRMRLARPIPPGVTMPADIAVTAAAAPSVAPPGSAATFTLTVTNTSAINLDHIVLTNRLPRGAVFTGATPEPAPDGTWTMALTAGASRTFTVSVTLPSTPGTVVDVASISAPVADQHPENNSAAAAIEVKSAECFVEPQPDSCAPPPPVSGVDLSVVATAAPATVAPTGVVTVNVAVRNSGSTAIPAAAIELALSGGAMLDTAPGAASLDPAVINLGPLEPGQTRWIVVRVMAPLIEGTFTLSATQLNGADANAANDSSSATFSVRIDACFVAPTDLVGRWRLDDDGDDDIGGRTALLRGTTAFDVGQKGRTLVLGGVGYGEVPDAAALKPAHFTIAAWIRPSSTVSWNSVIAKGASGLDGNMAWYDDTYWLGVSASGYPTLYTYHGLTQETKAAEKLAPGAWHHLAATYDGSIARLYVDGQEVAVSTIGQPLYYDVNPVPLTIGEDWQGGSANGAPFGGMIDDVTLHARALSPEDIAAMIGGSSSECVIAQPNGPPTTNMVDLVLIEGAPAVFRIAMMDPENAPVVGSMVGLPPGVTATSMAPTPAAPYHHLAFDGSPLPGSAGPYPVVMTMTDGVNTVTRHFTITVRPPNQSPIARADHGIATNRNPAVINVIANDTDPDGDAIRIVDTTPPARGFLNVRSGDGTIEYRTNERGWYTDSFTYTIEDSLGATATATVTVRVLAEQHDLTVTIEPARLILSPNQTAAWTLTVTNHSWMSMREVVARAEIPHQFTFLRSSVPPIGLPSLQFALGELAGGESRTVEIEAAAPDALGVYTHEADVRGGESETEPDNATTAIFEVQPAMCFAPASGLTGAWRFDDLYEEKFREEQGRVATHSSGEMLDFGRTGFAAAFIAGADSRVDLDTWRTPEFTVAVWTKPDVTVPTAPVIGDVVDQSGWQGFWLGYEHGVPVLTIHRRWDPLVKVQAASTVPANTWTHLAATFDSVTARLFVNGIEAASIQLEELWAGLPLHDGRLKVGYGFAGAATPELASYVGLLEDLLVYERALTAAELRTTVEGEPERCAIPTAGALGLDLAVFPEVAAVNLAARVEITVTNLSDGYLELASLLATTDSMLRFVDGNNPSDWHEKRLSRGPMKAGESHTFITEVYTPEDDGRFDFSVTAQESFSGTFAFAATKVVVAPASCFVNGGDFVEPCEINDHPSLTNPGAQSGAIGSTVTLPIVASDPDGPQPLRFIAEGLPPGLQIDPLTGVISGVIQPGQRSYVVRVEVTDGKLKARIAFDWTTNVRLTLDVGHGGAVRAGSTLCDGLAAAVTCVIDVNAGTMLELNVVQTAAGVSGWSFERQPVTQHAVVEIPMEISTRVSIAWMVRFDVTIENGFGPANTFVVSSLPVVSDAPPAAAGEFIHCAAATNQCVGQALFGSVVSLTPSSTLERVFTGMSGSCSGLSCELTVDRAGLAVTLHFEPAPLNLVVQVNIGGVVQINGDVLCQPWAFSASTCELTIPHGSQVTLTPAARPGFGWGYTDQSGLSTRLPLPSLGAETITATATFTMDNHRRVHVDFLAPVTLSLPGLPGTWDQVLRPAGESAPVDASPLIWAGDRTPIFACASGQPYSEPCVLYWWFGTAMTMAPRPTLPFYFVGWSGDCRLRNACTVPAFNPIFDDEYEPVVITGRFAPSAAVPLTLDLTRGGALAVLAQTGEELGFCSAIEQARTCVFEVPRASTVRLQPAVAPAWDWTASTGQKLMPNQAAEIVMSDPVRVGITYRARLLVHMLYWPSEWDSSTPPIVAEPSLTFTCNEFRTVLSEGACEAIVPMFSTVTLRDNPAHPTMLAFWEWPCSGNGDCTITTDEPYPQVWARFNAPPVPIAGSRLVILEDLGPATIVGAQHFFDPDDTLTLELVSVQPAGVVNVTQVGRNLLAGQLPNAFGDTTVTVRATDSAGLSATNTIVVSVFPVNDPPTLDEIPTTTIRSGERTAIDLVNLSTGAPNEPFTDLTISVTSSDPSVTGSIVYDAGRLLVEPPSRSSMATVTIEVTVADDPPGPPVNVLVVTRTFTLTVLPPMNTPPGSGVHVVASGPLSPAPIGVTFSGVTAAGVTTYVVNSGGLVPPDGFRFGNPPVWFDISTTATYTAPLNVCITYPAGTYANPLALVLLHYEGGRWVNRTVSVDVKNRIVCASVSSLSPFALAEPIAIEGRMHGEAHLVASGRGYDVRFRVAERELGSERGALDLRISTTHGKKKDTVDRFESTAIDTIGFFDDPAFRPGRPKKERPAADSAVFTGAGTWNGAPGYTFEARAIDRGEPGRGRDQFAITIFDPAGVPVHTVDAVLEGGNIQSDRLKPEHWRDR